MSTQDMSPSALSNDPPSINSACEGGLFNPHRSPLSSDAVAVYQQLLRDGNLKNEDFQMLFRAVRDSQHSRFYASCLVDNLFDELLGVDRPTSTALNMPHAHGYVPASLLDVMNVLEAHPLGANGSLCDIGCGLGRVPIFASLWSGQPSMGIEIQGRLTAQCHHILSQNSIKNVDIRQGDARTVEIPEATVYYLYQPFDGPILEAVLVRLKDIAASRPITIWWLGFQNKWQEDHKDWIRWIPENTPDRRGIKIGESYLKVK